MKNLETKITIDAPATRVWDILMNHTDYPNWNPFITQISGSITPGEMLAVTIHPPNKKPMHFDPVVLKNEPNKEFRWLGHLFVKGLFDGEHYFQLHELENGQTEFIQGEQFSGIMTGPILKMIEASTLTGFEAMNAALKKQAEKPILNY